MKTKACALVTACLMVVFAAVANANEQGTDQKQSVNNQQNAQLAEGHSKEQLRSWLTSIKPAAGHIQQDQQKTEYWQHSVMRKDKGHGLPQE